MFVLFLLPFTIAGYALLTNRVMAPVDLPYMTVPLNWMKEQYGISVGNASTNIHSDVYSQFIPWRKAVQWSLAHGEWGLRNPFMYEDDILLASEQPAVYSPFILIASLLPAALSFTFTAAARLFVAALTIFLFARELGCRERSALVAAAGWSLASGVVLLLHVSLSATWSWAPLVLLGVRRVVRTRAIGVLTFALAMLVVSAHPESALLVVVVGLGYAVFELMQHRAHATRAISLAFGAGAIALLLNAIHLLPFFEAIPHTMEYAHRDALLRNASRGVPLEHTLARASTAFLPYLHGRDWKLATDAPPSYNTGATGSILLALGIYALWRVRSRETWFFGGVFLFCLAAGSEWKPLAVVMGKIPLLDIALYDRFAFGAALALAVLAALGTEEILRRGGDRAAAVTMLGVLAVLAAGNAWAVRTRLVDHRDMLFGAHVVFAELALLAVGAAILLWRRDGARPAGETPAFRSAAVLGGWTGGVSPLLLALILAQRAISLDGLQKTFEQRQAYPPIPMLAAIEKTERPFRITGHGKALLVASATMYELEDVRGFSAMTLLRLRETFELWSIEQPVWFNRVDDLTRPFLSFLNVRYAITWDRDPPPDGWREVSRQRGSMLLENTRVLDRAFVPRSVRLGGDALAEMAKATDFSERAWIESAKENYERENGPGTLTIRNARLGYVIDADMQRDGWIVTSIAAWPGWRAYVDGKRLKTQIANHAFLAVHVPQGRHHVVLKYWPRSFVIGRAITFWTAAALAAAFLKRRLSRRSPKTY